MKKWIHAISALLGLFLMIYSTYETAEHLAVYSDLAAFQDRVAKSGKYSEVLKYGGESRKESFADMANKIRNLRSRWTIVGFVGAFLLIAHGGVFLSNFENRKQCSEQGRSG